jgi:hypothetical protein
VEHFTIQCTTCKARLIVKDESVIGEILACPKCNSMVQVVPPVGWKRPGSDSASSELPTVAAASASAPQAPAKKAAAVIPPALPSRGTTVAEAETAPARDAPAAAVPASASSGRLAPIAASMKQDWLMWTGGLVAGVVLGAGVWTVVTMQTPAPAVVAKATAAAQPDPAMNAVAPATPAAAEPPPSASPAVEPQPDVGLPPVAEAPPAAATETPTPPTEPEAPANVEPEAVKSPPAAELEAQPSLKLEPVSPPDTGFDASSEVAGDTAVPSAADAAPAAADVPLDDPSPVAPTPPAKAPALSSAEIEQRLAIRLTAVEFPGVSLAQFATFIEDVAGVRVVVDEAALQEAGLGRRTKITLRLQDVTAGEALRTAMLRAGLSYAVSQDGKIVIGPKH